MVFVKFLLRSLRASVSILLIVISFCSKTIAAVLSPDSTEYGKLYVTRWADDKTSAFSFSFDDGFKAQYDNVYPILEDYDFNATYFILPPYLSETSDTLIWRYGSWPMFLEMNYDGSELGSHSLNHLHLLQYPVGDTSTPNTIHYELYQSKKIIEEKTNYDKCITFAYPYAEHNQMLDSLTAIYYESARAIGIDPNPYSLTGIDWYSLSSYEVVFEEPRDEFEDDLDELYNFMNWIEGSISNGRWAIQLAHEVVPYSQLDDLISQGAYNPISNEWLIMLCDWLNERSDNGFLWIESIGNITKYIKERDSYSYQILSQSDSLIEINLTDDLSDDIYDFPLSAYISVPIEWQEVRLVQGNVSNVYQSFNVDSMQVILAKVIPDGGIIKLTKYDPSYVETETRQPSYFILNQNYPNPFNPSTKISWETRVGSWLTLKVYDVLGNEIVTLVDEYKPAGKYEVEFNVNGHSGEVRNLTSGIYYYQFQAGEFTDTKKMILLK